MVIMKSSKAFLISMVLFGSAVIYAQEVCEENRNQLTDLTGFVKEFVNDIKDIVDEDKIWMAATDKQVLAAKCKKKVPKLSKIKKHLKSYNNKSVELFGKQLEDDPKLVQALEKLLSKREIFKDVEVMINLEDAKYKVCKNAVCIAEKTFGKSLGPKLLYMMTKFGLNGSHLIYENARPWKEGEVDSYLQGFLDMPDYIFPMSHNKQCIHDKKDKGNTMANATMTFFSGIDNKTEATKEYTTYHELSHYIAGELEIDHDEDWTKLSSWRINFLKKKKIEDAIDRSNPSKTPSFGTNFGNSTGAIFSSTNTTGLGLGVRSNATLGTNLFGQGTSSNSFSESSSDRVSNMIKDTAVWHQAHESHAPETIVSKYGETNPAEDFAETMTAYRYNPELLKEVSPEKYSFIKEKVFNGAEFIKESECNKSLIVNHLKNISKVDWSGTRAEFDSQEQITKLNGCIHISDQECLEINYTKYKRSKYIESLKMDKEKKQLLLQHLHSYSL